MGAQITDSKTSTADTFFNEFYYPGLLAEAMAGKKPHAPKNISQIDRRQPELKLMTKDAQTKVSAGVTSNVLLGLLDFFLTGNRYYYVLFIIAAWGQLLHFPRRQQLVDSCFKSQKF